MEPNIRSMQAEVEERSIIWKSLSDLGFIEANAGRRRVKLNATQLDSRDLLQTLVFNVQTSSSSWAASFSSCAQLCASGDGECGRGTGMGSGTGTGNFPRTAR